MRLTDMNWPGVDELDRDTPVVFPIAALEQHGRHMPVFTDSMLVGEIARRAEEKLGDRVLFAPVLWLGNSEHHLDFPGTLSAAPRPYLDVLNDLLENFLRHGFRRLFLLNGHGGNDVPGKQVVYEVRQRHRQRSDLLLLFATYWFLGARPRETHAELEQPCMGHAGEWETSMMLRLAPHLVKDHASVPRVEFGNPFEPATRGWITKERTAPGHIGYPASATADKGEKLFTLFTNDVVALLERMLAWNGKDWSG
ncbi:MAG: creatininase family protein [Gemmataceae bacterium]